MSNLQCTTSTDAARLTAELIVSDQLSTSTFYVTIKTASEMHFNALRSLTQPLLDCTLSSTLTNNTPMIQALYQALQISVFLATCIEVPTQGTVKQDDTWSFCGPYWTAGMHDRLLPRSARRAPLQCWPHELLYDQRVAAAATT
jgi:hypothetical protein